jgi:hypothetical protein
MLYCLQQCVRGILLLRNNRVLDWIHASWQVPRNLQLRLSAYICVSLDRLLCQALLGAAFPMDQERLNRCSTGDTWGML